MENVMDDFDTKVTAEEFYSGWTEDEADYMANPCMWCQTHEAVEDGFCSFQCENDYYNDIRMRDLYNGMRQQKDVAPSGDEMYQTRYDAEAVQQEDAVSHTWEYEDHMAQWDNDPSPYDGTYSEE